MKIATNLLRGKKYFQHFTMASAFYLLNSGLSFAQVCPTIPAPIAPGTAVCAGEEAVLSATASETGSTLTWYDDATAGTSLHTGASFTTDELTGAGTVSFWVEESVPDCPSSPRTEVIVTLNPLPAVNAGNDITICEGSTVTLGVAGSDDYAWNNGILNGIAFTPLATATYIVTADNGTCTNTDEVVVTVSTPTVAGTISATDLTLCMGELIDATVSGHNGTVQWLVQPPGVPSFFPVGTGATLSVPSQQPIGTYIIKAEIANGACAAAFTNQLSVQVFPLPDVNGGANIEVCAGEEVTLTASGTQGTISWDNSVDNGVAFTPAATADYTVTLTDANGCTKTDEVTVTVHLLPNVSAGADATVCPNVEVTLAGSGASSYEWDNGVTDGDEVLPGTTTTYTVTGKDDNGCESTDEITITVSGTVPTVSAGADQAICEGSEITLTATGEGTFTWDNGVDDDEPFTPTATATYTVTANNGTCENTDEVTITLDVPSVAGTIALSETTVCEGATVTLTLDGETGDIEWFIQPEGGAYASAGIGNDLESAALTASSYTIRAEVKNGACAVATSAEEIITVNELPEVSAGSAQAVCAGTEVTLSGAGADDYAWDNGVDDGVEFTPSTTTTYTVTGTDANGCVNTAEVTITVNALPAAPVITADGPLTFCEGDDVVLTSSQATGNVWSGSETSASITVDEAGTYSVTYTDANGCSAISAVTTVAVHAAPQATAVLSNHTTLTASPAGQTYQWIDCATDTPVTGATSAVFTATANGSYKVEVTNSNGCTGVSSCISVTSVGLEEQAATIGVELYPNPTEGDVYIRIADAGQVAISVYDLQGKQVATYNNVKNGTAISLEGFDKGIYMLHVSNGKGSEIFRIVRN